MKIILASNSPRRKELLHQIIDTFDVIKSDFNEIFRAKVINSIVKYNTIGFIPMFGIPALVKFTQTRKVKGNENCSDNK